MCGESDKNDVGETSSSIKKRIYEHRDFSDERIGLEKHNLETNHYWLVVLYSILTLIDYSIPIPVYTYELNISFL